MVGLSCVIDGHGIGTRCVFRVWSVTNLPWVRRFWRPLYNLERLFITVEAVAAEEKARISLWNCGPSSRQPPHLDPTQSHSFAHQTSQAWCPQGRDSPFWRGASPRTLPSHESTSPGKPHWWLRETHPGLWDQDPLEGTGWPTLRTVSLGTSTESGEAQTCVCDATPASPSAPLAQGAQDPLVGSRTCRGERGVQLSPLWAKCTHGVSHSCWGLHLLFLPIRPDPTLSSSLSHQRVSHPGARLEPLWVKTRHRRDISPEHTLDTL